MMNYTGVLSEDEQTLRKLLAAGHRPKDGHAPLLSGKSLNAYIVAGLGSDHECSKLAEVLEKLRKGMHIMVREGTQEKNLQALVPVINEFNSFRFSLISDDRDPIDLKENGHLDYLVRRAISCGIATIIAIQMASINTARYFGIMDQGAIAPGFRADFILFDDLKRFKISSVFIDGIEIRNEDHTSDETLNCDHKSSTFSSPHSLHLPNTMHVKSLDNDYIFRIPACGSRIQVIGVTPGQITTEKRIVQAKLDGHGFAVADPQKDLAKLAVIERHHKLGNVGLGFVQGMGLQKGAIVSSIAHDSHNLVVAGINDIDMLTAARYICSIGGGVAVAYNGQIIASIPLPIAGLMSDKSIEEVVSNLKTVNKACKKLGNNVIRDPFMLLSFLSLSVVPSLKLTDKGLVDVDKFELTELFIK
jgi:adenine deaminase